MTAFGFLRGADIFDILPYDVFMEGYSNVSFEERLKRLYSLLIVSNFISSVPQLSAENTEELEDIVDDFFSKGYEGAILRKKSSPYEGKRTKNILKIKSKEDGEYTIKKIYNGLMTVQDGGKISKERLVVSIGIEHKGVEVIVGSGLSLSMRRCMFESPESYIGNVVTIEHCGETDAGSLRHPVLKAIHGKKRIV